MKYTVITYLFGNADILRDPLVITPNTKYVVFTDTDKIKSSIWTPYIINSNQNFNDLRAQVALAKFSPFRCPSDKYIVIDASHQIKADLTYIFDKITDNTLCVKPHPEHVNIGQEISRWQSIRHMSNGHTTNIHNMICMAGNNYYNSPIYEGCCIGVSNSYKHQYLFHAVISMLKLLQYNGIWFPSNQIVFSFLISKLSMPFCLVDVNEFANRYHHNTWNRIYESS